MTTRPIQDILTAIPHRYPFLLVDKILEVTAGQSIIAVKNVTANEPQFTGHFPEQPIMPGVLLVEALAQACGLLIKLSHDDANNQQILFYLTSLNNVKFRQPVVPGDTVHLNATLTRQKMSYYLFTATATVDGKLACQADISLFATLK